MSFSQVCVRCGKLVPQACLSNVEVAACVNGPTGIPVPAPSPASVALPASFKVEVIADSSGKWCGNGARYQTEEAARMAGYDLSMRWALVRDWRVSPSDDEPTWALGADGRMSYIKKEAA